MKTAVADKNEDLPDWTSVSNFEQAWTTLIAVDNVLQEYNLEVEVHQSSGTKGRCAFRIIPREV